MNGAHVDTVKIRYIGPMTEGLWITAGEHGAHDFSHHEVIDGDGFVDVPVALARELLEQQEPVPPGDPIVVGYDEDTEAPILGVPLAPVWELEAGATLPDSSTAADGEAKPNKSSSARKSTSARAR